MLLNIKYKYITKIILSQLNEAKKLKLIRYNKNLQKIFDIEPIIFKFYSSKCVIYEKDGKAKEYSNFDDNLLFEGEYLNGKRCDGKGKEYYSNGELKYEGEYLNGKWDGKGKQYNEYGELIFEGEYLNGRRNGKGKEYNEYGRVIYEGEFFNDGKWNGKVYEEDDKCFFESKKENNRNIKGYNEYRRLVFRGEYLNGKIIKGKEFDEYGKLIYEGCYLNGERWKGEIEEYLNLNHGCKSHIKIHLYHKRNRKGFESYRYYNIFDEALLIFIGKYLNGKRNGKGLEYLVKEEYLETSLIKLEDLKNKNQINDELIKKYYEEINRVNIIFIGEYLNGYRFKGKEYHKGRLEFVGEYLFNRKWNGKGYDENGYIIYKLINGTGFVKEYSYGILEFEGEYLNGKRNGKGKEYNKYGKLIFEGEYLNGKRWNGKVKKYNNYDKLILEGEYSNGEINNKKCVIF